jgi:hypothetical protein
MAVLDDIIAQQLRQYPGGPADPFQAVLPQSYADRLTGGLRAADPATMANVPGPEEEAGQGSNILGELAQRWTPSMTNFWLRPSVAPHVANVLAQLAPLALGLSGEGDEGELVGPARATARFFGDEVYPYSSAEREAFMRKFPGSAHETYSAPSRTMALPDLEQESRYHGATSGKPITRVLPPEQVPQAGPLLLGKGFYTTDDLYVAKGYAGTGAGPTYRIYEINPEKLKFLDADNERIPMRVLDRVDDLLPNIIKDRNAPNGVQAVKGRWILNKKALAQQTGYDVLTRFTDQSPMSEQIQAALRQALQDEGYAGLKHVGGGITGGVPHNVKIYFNPGRDVRMRVLPSDEWKQSFIRDVPIPGAPAGSAMGFRLGRQRVPAPVIGR